MLEEEERMTASATLTTSLETNLTKYKTILDGVDGEKIMSGGEVSLLSLIHSSGGSREEALKSIASKLDLTYWNFQG